MTDIVYRTMAADGGRTLGQVKRGRSSMDKGVVEDGGLLLQWTDTRMRFKVEKRSIVEVLLLPFPRLKRRESPSKAAVR